MKYFLKTPLELCTGCSACAAACPTRSITLRQTDDGFFKYFVDEEKCIDCGLCNSVCPIQTDNPPNGPLFAAAVRSRNMTIWKRSSSGGAFSEICRAISERFNQEPVFYFGAVWNDQLQVEHRSVDSFSTIDVFCRSKYVQSNVGNTFLEVKEHLEKGIRVVYSGTPCQIAGLRNFLQKDFDNLFLIDFICHGVGSRSFFQKCLDDYETQQHSKVLSYVFRSKHRYDERNISRITFASGACKYVKKDDYNKLFINQICLNSSCQENCRFRHKERYSDFTLADFNGLNDIFPHVFDWLAYSTLIANSAKAMDLLSLLKKSMKVYSCSPEDIARFQKCYDGHPSGNPERSAFFADLKAGMSVPELISKYFTPKEKHISLSKRLWNQLPYPLRYTFRYLCRHILRAGGKTRF